MPRTLLVVDDSATMRKVFEITFAGEDITVFGHDGSASLMDQVRGQQPVAAVVDINLPGVDAYAIVRALKSDAMGNLPVLLLYSEHSPVDEGRAREVGADGTLQKPFDTQAAIDRVKQLLGTATARTTSPGPFAPGVAARPPAAVATPGNAANSARPVAPSAAGVGSIGSRQPAAGGAKATQMFVSPPTSMPQASAPAAPPPPPRPVAPPVTTVQSRPIVPQPPPSAAQVGPPRRDSVELEMDLGGSDDVALDAPVPARAQPSAVAGPVAAMSAEVAQRAAAMGLSPAQVDAVTALTREVVERVVWEVVPQLAETLIREEIRRLTAE